MLQGHFAGAIYYLKYYQQLIYINWLSGHPRMTHSIGIATLRTMFSLDSSFVGCAGDFQPWLHIWVIWELFKISNARPHSSGSDLIRKGYNLSILF